MTLSGLVINIGIIAIIFTAFIAFFLKKHKSYVMSFLQCFTGVLFIFSGWVKAIDPMGTAFKMEQYFSEFELTFAKTAFSFISPIFPALSSISIWFSVGMIVFEIVLGIMLLFGIKPKLSAWLFFLLVAFFTVLTGFTYLTGYVKSGENFFDFAKWGPYTASNMRVTDCGCFGDFIKLEPKISFFKDIALIIPAIYFLLRHKLMHNLLSSKWNTIAAWGSTAILIIYCLYNFVWNEPHIDFRPFTNGKNVAAARAAEDKAMAEVKIIANKVQDLKTGKIMEIPYAQYMADTNFWDKSKFENIEQIKTEPTVKKTKISEFDITDFSGVSMIDLFFKNPKNHFMVTSPKAKFTSNEVKAMVQDSIFKIDSIYDLKGVLSIQKKFLNVMNKEVVKTDYVWDNSFLEDLKKLKPILDAAQKEGADISVVIGGISEASAIDLAKDSGINAKYLTADDILLKTIMRSNPGLILWRNGVLGQTWHKRHVPDYNFIKANFFK
ncbi:MAG: hypothetical protein RLZZ546_2073 [Bacteroidota bacterium]